MVKHAEDWDHSFSTYVSKCTCTYKGVRNVRFSENVAYVLHGWFYQASRKIIKGSNAISKILCDYINLYCRVAVSYIKISISEKGCHLVMYHLN